MSMIEYISDTTMPAITDIYKAKRGTYSNHILCFDLEATSLFQIDGEYRPFDYSKPPDYYHDKEKRALPYIWQFGYDGVVYYSRDFHAFADLLEKISDKNIHQYVYCHNLSYEFQWLVGLFIEKGWHLSDVLARGLRKVISFTIQELNITFRCSYALTGLSLDHCAEYYKCKVKKLVGSLNYNVARSPITWMSKKELAYCEHDILVMYEFMKQFKAQYGSIKQIPLTQTGEVRKEINSKLTYWYHRDVWDKIPPVHIYMAQMCSFMGGIAHANHTLSGKVIEYPKGWDYQSQYPAQMVTRNGFPVGQWFTADPSEADDFKDRYALLYHVRWKNIKSRFVNHYIPLSKCIEKVGCRVDNGRVMKADQIEMYLTDVDYDIIRNCYEFESEEVIDLWACRKGRLPKIIVEFILEMYGRKTKLKGVKSTPEYDAEAYYAKAKQCCNALFGISAYNPIKQAYEFDMYSADPWGMRELNTEFLNEKLADMKKSYSVLFTYGIGCWVTAYARERLFAELVTGGFGKDDPDMDRDSIYYDTDSDKVRNPEKHFALIDKINERNMQRIKEAAEYYELDIELFMPKDPKGKPRVIGELEADSDYKYFKTLGAKKYAYVEPDDSFHITIAGVPKSAAVCMKNGVDDLRKGFKFPYQWKNEKGETIGKLNMIYDDDQEAFEFIDADGNYWLCEDISHAIIAQPTTYELGITEDYEALIEYFDNRIYY